jgi:aryl-alcohol dehydrogenase-like predicted oxidoreductase
VSKPDADRTLDVLLEHGVNHVDVAASYGDDELRVARWPAREPGTSFLATKSGTWRCRPSRAWRAGAGTAAPPPPPGTSR